MNFSWYGRIRFIGETFIEYPSASYGRRWLDVSVTEMDFEMWAGRFHLTLSITREQCPASAALKASREYLAACRARFVR